MRKQTLILSIILLSSFIITGISFAAGGPGDKPYFKKIEIQKKKKNAIFNLSLDVQGGINISNTTFDTQDSSVLKNTGSKVGGAFGATLSLDFIGFGFTTGFVFNSKGFTTSNNENLKSNYLNIPLLYYFDFDFNKVIIEGNLGPYFGLLLSQSESQLYEMKNFDLGFSGNLQGTYMFHPMIGALLGVKYEYGGLNNLGNSETINKTTTQTWYIYTGVKFAL
jgi:hypothetical protein